MVVVVVMVVVSIDDHHDGHVARTMGRATTALERDRLHVGRHRFANAFGQRL
jgi:hypothetical protein